MSYSVSAECQDDLFEIWSRIAMDSLDLANRIEREFKELFESLARMPGQGHTRGDPTKRPVLFFPMYSLLIVYDPGQTPIRILDVVRGKRDVKRCFKAGPKPRNSNNAI